MAEQKIRVASPQDLEEGKLLATQANEQRLLLTRIQGRPQAIINRCPHMGMKMTRGELSDGVLKCPWHGSRFDFCTGANLDWVNAFAGVPMPKWTHGMISMGKSPAPLTTVSVEETEGEIFVHLDT